MLLIRAKSPHKGLETKIFGMNMDAGNRLRLKETVISGAFVSGSQGPSLQGIGWKSNIVQERLQPSFTAGVPNW